MPPKSKSKTPAKSSVQVVEFVEPCARRPSAGAGAGRPSRDSRKPSSTPKRGREDDRRAGAEGGAKRRRERDGSGAVVDDPDGGSGLLDRREHMRNFHSMYREVIDFGASQFEGKDKKVWEAKKMASLGSRSKHVIKMPYPMLVGVMKKRERREKAAEEHQRQAEVVTGKKLGTVKKKRKDKQRQKMRKPPSAAGTESLGGGSFKNGVLYLKKPPK